MADTECPFCERIERGEYDDLDLGVAHFEPLNPVTPGHRLFVPEEHCEHPCHDAVAMAMEDASRWGALQEEDFNLVTSSGPAATQTVAHIHVHYIPRRHGDGLTLPWTDQKVD